MRGLLAGAALLCGGVSALAQSASIPMLDRVVPVGQTQRIFWFTSLDPDCRSMGEQTINVLEAPAYGQVRSARGSDFTVFPSNNPRARCNTRKSPVMNIFYTPAQGYRGEDTFVVEAVNPLGQPTRVRFHVFVR